ncbi:hypothetical protein [Allosediminivita pacifica]|uniref:Uncharacterized protein n=1 Tax=Allosediminivita pacifica TaxID=1267769 RepID=A0A2T6AUJ5_9RHOB|nr:hypothetical protein [Allosediminivita pacifica]PTX47485.1 hypothetical protein C8N44_112109 [Allosediminivita pacifica]
MSNASVFWICTCLILIVAFLMIYLLSLKLLVDPKVALAAPGISRDLREWLSAFGGYAGALAALAAAVISVSMISRQISTASDQHLEMMKFQVHGALVQAQQVQSAASVAHGNVVQLLDSTVNRDEELVDGELESFSHVAEETRKQIIETRLTENVYDTQGRRPAFGSFEAALESWISAVATVRQVSNEDAETGESRRQMLRRLSGPLVTLELELRGVETDSADFIRRWSHLSP